MNTRNIPTITVAHEFIANTPSQFVSVCNDTEYKQLPVWHLRAELMHESYAKIYILAYIIHY